MRSGRSRGHGSSARYLRREEQGLHDGARRRGGATNESVALYDEAALPASNAEKANSQLDRRMEVFLTLTRLADQYRHRCLNQAAAKASSAEEHAQVLDQPGDILDADTEQELRRVFQLSSRHPDVIEAAALWMHGMEMAAFFQAVRSLAGTMHRTPGEDAYQESG